MLSRADLAAFRKQLLALANRAEEVRSELATEETQKEGDGLAIDPYRPAELHSQAADAVVTAQLRDLEEGVEREALLAVERIDLGTFGKCERCGKAIPKGRLEAIPYARICMNCAS
jgi:RNA polymerase-binding transcription factor DksA